VPRNQTNKNTPRKNNDFTLFSATKSIENTTKNAIQIPWGWQNCWIWSCGYYHRVIIIYSVNSRLSGISPKAFLWCAQYGRNLIGESP